MSELNGPPPRLLDGEGPAAECLRRALDEQEVTLPRFVLLREKRLRRARLARGVWGLGAAALLLLILPRFKHEAPQASISAEQPSSVAVAKTQVASPTEAAAPPPPTASPPPVSAVKVPATASSLARVAKPALAGDAEPAAPAPERSLPVGSAKACAEQLRGGSAAEALRCYERLAGGSGMSAELALFEQARLEGKVLRQPGRALATLESYRRRFPQGSLRAEVMLAQIEWLVAAGDTQRARALVDEALASGLLRERTVELERLRATLALPDTESN